MPTESRADPLFELNRRIRGGDIAAFEQLFRLLHAPLCEVVDSYVRSQDVAEEIVQDLYFVLWTTRERLPAARSFRAYIFGAARNRALHHLRHRTVERRWAEHARHEPDISGHGASTPHPDQTLLANEQTAAIQSAIGQLPPRTRVAFLLSWEHEMSHADVATAMGISVKGVEKLVGVARAKLRVLLGELTDPLSGSTVGRLRGTR